MLGSLIVFYLCVGTMEVSYNFLLRRTARNDRFTRYMDVFSGMIGAWSVSNVAVIAFHAARTTSPEVTPPVYKNVRYRLTDAAKLSGRIRCCQHRHHLWTVRSFLVDHMAD